MIDCIFVSCSKNADLIQQTETAISTCRKSRNVGKVIVVETWSESQVYDAEMVYYIQRDPTAFNYNRSLNKGIKKCTSRHVGLFNNDLVFGADWATVMLKAMKANGLRSASPPEKEDGSGVQVGYNLFTHIVGWAIIVERSALKDIGLLNEDFGFWAADRAYIDQIEKAGIRHGVVHACKIKHRTSQTLETVEGNDRKNITSGSQYRWRNTGVHTCTFSIVLPSYLGDYPKAATDRHNKLRRAINSVLEQKYTDFELIIVADGCDDTIEVVREFRDRRIRLIRIDKQPTWSGKQRLTGAYVARGKWIIYIDSDDFWLSDHLVNVQKGLRGDWCYFDDFLMKKGEKHLREVKLEVNRIGTSNIVHRRSLPVSWGKTSGYGHDWQFVKQLQKYESHYIPGSGYVVCHKPGSLDE